MKIWTPELERSVRISERQRILSTLAPLWGGCDGLQPDWLEVEKAVMRDDIDKKSSTERPYERR